MVCDFETNEPSEEDKLRAIEFVNFLCQKDIFGRPKLKALRGLKLPSKAEITLIILNPKAVSNSFSVSDAILAMKTICKVMGVVCPIVEKL